ncbi:MAG: DNA replication and repair protein RecF [Chloroflexota bacterium]|nr:MAG: DNA replication and repair protein RecF [Chloroflexota bacterium]
MYLQYLSLTNFRNYARLELNLTPGTTLVYGANAQGKTNLLEALYYLATARSPYTTSDRQLIHWRAADDPIPFARLAAEVHGRRHSAPQRIEITLMLERAPDGGQRFKKAIRLNGADKRVMDMVGVLSVVLFLPRDLALVEGAPAERRRFMDETLSQVDRDYLEALTNYEKVLPQRNALLRRLNEGHGSPRELDYWDAQLVRSGSVIIAGRQRFLRELEVDARRAHHDLTGRRETLTLVYQPNFAPTAGGDGQLSFNALGLDLHRELTPEQIAPQFASHLKAEQGLSIRRGVTLSGPHRDELRLRINDHDAGLYGSRGQARTAVMALKLAELAWMAANLGEPPLLLLDEVIAELDAARRAYLLARLTDVTQTLMTTTERDIFTPEFLTRTTLLHIAEGQIAPTET